MASNISRSLSGSLAKGSKEGRYVDDRPNTETSPNTGERETAEARLPLNSGNGFSHASGYGDLYVPGSASI